MDISVREIGKHMVISFHGDMEMFYMVKLKKQIFDLVDRERPRSLIVDMAHNNYIDSSGIAHVADLNRKMRDRGGEFGLLNVNEKVQNLLKRSNVSELMKIYFSEEELPTI